MKFHDCWKEYPSLVCLRNQKHVNGFVSSFLQWVCLFKLCGWLALARSPSSALLHLFGGWFPTKIEYGTMSTLILSSLLEDLVGNQTDIEAYFGGSDSYFEADIAFLPCWTRPMLDVPARFGAGSSEFGQASCPQWICFPFQTSRLGCPEIHFSFHLICGLDWWFDVWCSGVFLQLTRIRVSNAKTTRLPED